MKIADRRAVVITVSPVRRVRYPTYTPVRFLLSIVKIPPCRGINNLRKAEDTLRGRYRAETNGACNALPWADRAGARC